MGGGRVQSRRLLNVHLHRLARGGGGADCGLFGDVGEAPRLRGLPRAEVLGSLFPVATGWRTRLLGLSRLNAAEAGPGLLIRRCRSVHTFGMRFALDLYFLSDQGDVVGVRLAVPRRRIVLERKAAAVLELPAEC